jgi:hypothetical protein
VENERDHDAVRGGVEAVVFDDRNEGNGGPGAALVQVDVELTYRGA